MPGRSISRYITKSDFSTAIRALQIIHADPVTGRTWRWPLTLWCADVTILSWRSPRLCTHRLIQ